MLLGLDRRRIVLLGAAYFVLKTVTMLVFQFRWTADAAIFGSFWEAGKHLDYSMHPLVWVTKEGFAELNLNPPISFPLFQLFALVDPQVGQRSWLLVSAAVHLACVWILYRHGAQTFSLVWLMTTPIVSIGLGLGQVYILLLALGLGIWLSLRSGRILLAAVLMGILVAFKPNFAIWGVLAFAAGHFRAAIVAGSVALALTLLPAWLYGPDIYRQWLEAVALDRHNLFPHDVSLNGFFHRLGIPGASIAWAALSLGVLAWAYRIKPSLCDLTPAVLLAAMVLSPLAWIDYILVIVPFLIMEKLNPPIVLAILLTYGAGWSPDALLAGGPAVIAVSVMCLASVLIMAGYYMSRIRDYPQGAAALHTGGAVD